MAGTTAPREVIAIVKADKTKKKRATRVQYKSRGRKANMRYGPPYSVDLEKFARDVWKVVRKDYDPDYDPRA